MTTICGSCGTSNDAEELCQQCGQPLATRRKPGATPRVPETPEAGGVEPAPTAPMPTAPPPYPAPPQPAPPQPAPPQPAPQQGYTAPLYPAQGGYPQGGFAGMPSAPRPPMVNPFLGWPISDYLRDVGAAFCLFASLGMYWDASGDKGGEKWWVIVSVLFAAASLVLPYLLKAKVIPGWSGLHSQLAKLAANAPFLASVIAALVNEAINTDSERDGAIGVAIGMGLAGVTLALQPRQAEESPTGMYAAPGDGVVWNRLAYGIGIAAVVVAIVMFAGSVLHFSDDLFDEILGFFTIVLVSLVMLLVMAAWPLAGAIGGSAAWRRVFATSTLTVIVIALFAMADDGTALFYWPLAEKWYGDIAATGFAGTFLLGAAGGLAVCRSLARRQGEQVEPVNEWSRTASRALMVSAAASVVSIVALIIGIIHNTDDLAVPIVLTVLVVVVCGCAAAGSVLLGNAQRNRIVVLAMIAGMVIVGFIVMGVANAQDLTVENVFTGPSLPVTGWIVGAWVTLPALAAFALTVPKPVRTAFGPLIQPQPAYPQGYPQGYPQQPGYPQGFPHQGYPQQGGHPPNQAGGYPPQQGQGQQPTYPQ